MHGFPPGMPPGVVPPIIPPAGPGMMFNGPPYRPPPPGGPIMRPRIPLGMDGGFRPRGRGRGRGEMKYYSIVYSVRMSSFSIIESGRYRGSALGMRHHLTLNLSLN